MIHLITRAKTNPVAYEDPPPKTGGRGRPSIDGAKLKLYELFAEMRNQFEEATVEMYKRRKAVGFLKLDLVGKPIDEKVHFVLIMDGEEYWCRFVVQKRCGAQQISENQNRRKHENQSFGTGSYQGCCCRR